VVEVAGALLQQEVEVLVEDMDIDMKARLLLQQAVAETAAVSQAALANSEGSGVSQVPTPLRDP
jgi:hypothetical protein